VNRYRMKKDQYKWQWIVIGFVLCVAAGLSANPPAVHADPGRSPQIMWVNHMSLLPGDSTVVSTSFNSTSSGVGGGLTGLVIKSSTVGEIDSFGGNKVVHMALDLPKQTKIKGVRVCYEVANISQDTPSFITQIRLAQVQDPPSTAVVLLDDGTDLTDQGPVCVDSEIVKPAIKSKFGSVLLSLRLNFGDIMDKIVIRAVGLRVK
jgi:hypothetical protein